MNVFRYRLRLHIVIFKLIKSASFIQITIVGNLIISSFALLFFYFEAPNNPNVASFIDALWWAFATATTVGYGDIIPLSTAGKLLGIMLMLTGTALFATYTALFAQTILEDDFIRFNLRSRLSQKKETDLIDQLKHQQEVISKQIEVLQKARNDEDNT